MQLCDKSNALKNGGTSLKLIMKYSIFFQWNIHMDLDLLYFSVVVNISVSS